MEIRIKLNTVKNAMLFATICDNYEEDIDYSFYPIVGSHNKSSKRQHFQRISV